LPSPTPGSTGKLPATSGTTLQLSSQMPQPLPQFSKLLAPGFLVHEFALGAAKQVRWDVWKYQWDGTKFRRNPQPFTVP